MSKILKSVFLTSCLLLLTSNVLAQQSSLSLSPSLTEIVIKPGYSTTQRYKLTNLGDPAIVKIRIMAMESRDSLGNINLKNKFNTPIRFELQSQTISLDEAFFLKNSSSQEFFLKVEVPEDTPQRDYYFTLIAESQPPPAQEGAVNIRAKISLGTNLLITVTTDGKVEIKPKISLFEVIPKNKIKLFGLEINLFNSLDEIPVVLTVDNRGINVIKPRGEISLRGPLWQSKRFEIKPQNVLAKSQRQLSIESAKISPRPYPLYPRTLTLSGFFFGVYKLSASISFGQGTPILYATTSFLVFPVKLFILLILLLLGATFILKKLRTK